LGEIVERISGKPLDIFAKENIFAPLNDSTTTFLRKDLNQETPNTLYKNPNLLARIAPTENVCGQQSYLGGIPDKDCGKVLQILRGEVHDPTANRMNGVAGHAGLFSTADDLARFCQMLLNGGTLDGKRILISATVARMTAPIVVSEEGATRGLGWDINTGFSSNRGELFPLGSFGHTGFTGTSVWIDRVSQTFVIFLSNRVHPNGKGDVTPLRAKVATVTASAIEDTPVEAIRLAEDIYASQVAAQIPKFKKESDAAKVEINRVNVPGYYDPNQNRQVLNGIDVLEKNNFKQLDDLKIGLVTNQTGRDLSGKATIDVLKDAPNVKLVALFSPEHGIRGLADEKVSDSTDEKTGLPVFSLYGETRRPKSEQLKDLDALVYDIQDVGVRFYTYESTLLNVLEEAAKAGKPVFVLDRPNPINGVDVEGAVADADKLSFVVSHTVPVRHGMTIGELALMLNAEKKIGADLRVVQMENWSRSNWFDQTNQTWINPSPNMRSLTEAALYPGIGLLETTNLSVGRGTDTPFEIVGAPWIDGRELASALNQKNLRGVRFVPVNFKPSASVFKDENCGGINIIITDRTQFQPVKTGVEIALALVKIYPNNWKIDNFNRLLANTETFEMVRRGAALEDIEKVWQTGADEFKKRRARFLLYK
ncbi:MAG: exo-beta-N-acetylmuramidase NamZ domain-containing protein, partial [Pyrinomonadaceae bacterium]